MSCILSVFSSRVEFPVFGSQHKFYILLLNMWTVILILFLFNSVQGVSQEILQLILQFLQNLQCVLFFTVTVLLLSMLGIVGLIYCEYCIKICYFQVIVRQLRYLYYVNCFQECKTMMFEIARVSMCLASSG